MAKKSDQQIPEAPEVKTAKSKSPSTQTDPEYTVKPGEEGHYHLLIEKVIWDNTTNPLKPIKLSQPQVYKCNDKDYRTFLNEYTNLGYTIVKILHDPDTAKTKQIHADIEKKKEQAASGGLSATKR